MPTKRAEGRVFQGKQEIGAVQYEITELTNSAGITAASGVIVLSGGRELDENEQYTLQLANNSRWDFLINRSLTLSPQLKQYSVRGAGEGIKKP
jgi:hypothetical protein